MYSICPDTCPHQVITTITATAHWCWLQQQLHSQGTKWGTKKIMYIYIGIYIHVKFITDRKSRASNNLSTTCWIICIKLIHAHFVKTKNVKSVFVSLMVPTLTNHYNNHYLAMGSYQLQHSSACWHSNLWVLRSCGFCDSIARWSVVLPDVLQWVGITTISDRVIYDFYYIFMTWYKFGPEA